MKLLSKDVSHDPSSHWVNPANTDIHIVDLVNQFQTLLHDEASAPMFHFCDAKGRTSQSFNRGDLDKKARGIAALLLENEIVAGERVLLVYSFSIDVIPAVLGCFYAGVIPCPVAPPNPTKLNEELTRFEDLATDTGCKAVLTNNEYILYRSIATVRWPLLTRNTHWRNLPWLKTDGTLPPPIKHCHQSAPDDIAFLQYTSGSTSTPKGVMISFRNLIAQLDAVHDRCKIDHESRLVAWIPYYHDHCLVAGILNTMCRGGVLYLMSPLTFLANPAIWFDVLTRVKATGTAAPDFAFNYSVRKTTNEQRQQWDLSFIDIFQSGGEPIRAESVNRFFDAFAVSGLRRDIFSPGYGMAEHVLCISNKVGTGKQISIDRQQYELANRVVINDGPDCQTLIGNGKPLDGVNVAIVDPNTHERLTVNDVGEIWIDSESKAMGYWNKPALNESEFNACIVNDTSKSRYLRTGDLGFFYEEELFVAGRIKDTIILRGRNIHPQDVEAIVSIAHNSVRPGRAVAFSHALEGESEHLAVVTELREKHISNADAKQIANSIRQQITAALSVSCRTLFLVAPGTIKKTTSGKHQRVKTRDYIQRGLLDKRILWQDTLQEYEQTSVVSATPEELSETIVLEHLIKCVAAIDLRPADDIDVDAPLASFALDSFAVMSLMLEITTWSGRDVSHEAFLESGTLQGVALTIMQAEKMIDTVAPDGNFDTLSIVPTVNQPREFYPLNPSQAWMFEPDGPVPHGWTIGGLFLSKESVQIDVMQCALDIVVDFHEALRLRVQETDQGWQQRIEENCSPQVECVDLYTLSGTALRNEVEHVVAQRQQSMNLTTGPAIQLAVLRVDATEIERILFVVHHIAVDAYSCEFVAADTLRTYQQLLHGHKVTLQRPKVSYREYMDKLIEMASSEQVMASADYFLNMPSAPPLQLEYLEGRNIEGNFTAESLMLSYEQTEKLMKHIPYETGLSTATLLLTCLGNALTEHLGVSTHRFELVHHGRTDSVEDLDVSRTCAWMAINYPVALELDPDAEPIAQARSVKTTVDQIPRNGLDHGLLTSLHPDLTLRARIKKAALPEMRFLWFGQYQGVSQTLSEKYPLAPEKMGTSFDHERAMPYLKYFYGTVHNGCIRLDAGSSHECFSDATRQTLVSLWRKHIEELIEHCE